MPKDLSNCITKVQLVEGSNRRHCWFSFEQGKGRTPPFLSIESEKIFQVLASNLASPPPPPSTLKCELNA